MARVVTEVVTEIEGMARWGGIRFNMREIIVENESVYKKYLVVWGTETILDGTFVKQGDRLGKNGELPNVFMLGAPKFEYPKSISVNSAALITVEADFFASDGKFYIARFRYMLTPEDGSEMGLKYMLKSEALEQKFYRADDSILSGKTISNMPSLYGFKENEIPDSSDVIDLQKWLQEMRLKGKINFYNPYAFLMQMEDEIGNIIMEVFDKRIKE